MEKEQSSLASQVTMAAISSTLPKRFIGIFDSMNSMCCGVIWSKIAVLTAAGVMQLTRMPVRASSLPSDLVRPMTAALEAEYADALGLPSLPAIDAVEIKDGEEKPIRIEILMNNSSGLYQVDGLLKAKLRGSGLEPYVEVIAHIDTEAEKRLVPIYHLET